MNASYDTIDLKHPGLRILLYYWRFETTSLEVCPILVIADDNHLKAMNYYRITRKSFLPQSTDYIQYPPLVTPTNFYGLNTQHKCLLYNV